MNGTARKTKRPIVSYKTWDVVTVPFPFTDQRTTKRRPALVLSSYNDFGRKVSHSVLAMITSAGNPAWPLDTEIVDQESAGLPAPSRIRMKLFTLDNRLIVKKIGTLTRTDISNTRKNLKLLLPLS